MVADRHSAGGRPRAFDEDEALDAAIDVFWRLGYEGASLAELTKAMAINKPSLYLVFGSKEELFVRALERYGLSRYGQLDAALDVVTAYEVIESYLRATVESATREGSALGCLSIQGGLSSGPTNVRIPHLLAEYRQGIEDIVAKALAKTADASARNGEFGSAALAAYVVTIGQGLAVHAGGGVPRAKLDAVVDVTMAGLANLLAPQRVNLA